MTTVEEDRVQARTHGLLGVLRDAEADFRRSYARVLEVVAELEAGKTGAVVGFGTTARLLTGVLTVTSRRVATARVEQAQQLTPRQSLTGEALPPLRRSISGLDRLAAAVRSAASNGRSVSGGSATS